MWLYKLVYSIMVQFIQSGRKSKINVQNWKIETKLKNCNI
jgi:hypothetical protein